ncbi:hypothetical protein D9M70_573400 [compost metagenome]
MEAQGHRHIAGIWRGTQAHARLSRVGKQCTVAGNQHLVVQAASIHRREDPLQQRRDVANTQGTVHAVLSRHLLA